MKKKHIEFFDSAHVLCLRYIVNNIDSKSYSGLVLLTQKCYSSPCVYLPILDLDRNICIKMIVYDVAG